MPTPELTVRRLSIDLRPDPRRVLLRPFIPSLIVKPSAAPELGNRVLKIYHRVMELDEERVAEEFERLMREFDDRHLDLNEEFLQRFESIAPALPMEPMPSEKRQLLLGAYFTNEYSLESAALFNPSIVPHPDQEGVKEGCLRFVMSLRATGEGHISSVVFRSGILCADGEVELDPVSRHVVEPHPQPAAQYERETFRRKLLELGVSERCCTEVTGRVDETFVLADLHQAIAEIQKDQCGEALRQACLKAKVLAEANYTVRFRSTTGMSERVLFPFSPSESNGIEDARFVKFEDDAQGPMYYATYTAYNGTVALPQMVETRDFLTFRFSTLNGGAVKNKGLAMFPRKIGGRFVMLGRQDSENIHLMSSDDPHFWHESEVLVEPREPWEFVQLGNCGSPIETEAGWLVLTHGVGAMRKYSIGAVLLDLEDPSKVIGRLRNPLLGPNEDEREGYVPNVVYSCGGLVHGGRLILPYAVSDSASRFAVVELAELIDAMKEH
ncbi:glycoside hydrolase family 130 protein [Haloferula chungangensis]|uniref:Glycoside hydrolase family 130 protein n=1 Tax=Haloferula chungangensis TaxID=1048331 RepID=A0ABW2L6I8_9BACT